jgi:hypothetical protein
MKRLCFGLSLLLIAGWGADIVKSSFSRDDEREADRAPSD